MRLFDESNTISCIADAPPKGPTLFEALRALPSVFDPVLARREWPRFQVLKVDRMAALVDSSLL
jgi:hypothetical protein